MQGTSKAKLSDLIDSDTKKTLVATAEFGGQAAGLGVAAYSVHKWDVPWPFAACAGLVAIIVVSHLLAAVTGVGLAWIYRDEV